MMDGQPAPQMKLNFRAQFFRKVDNAIHWKNLYPVDSAQSGFPNTYPLGSD